MRWLSISLTFRLATSDTRRPAPYASPNAALYFGPGAASSSRRTSSGASTLGSLRGWRTSVRWRTTSGRPSVVLKKNRSAATAPFMVGGVIPVSR